MFYCSVRSVRHSISVVKEINALDITWFQFVPNRGEVKNNYAKKLSKKNKTLKIGTNNENVLNMN